MRAVVLALALLVPQGVVAQAAPARAEWIGTWEGAARIATASVRESAPWVRLTIAPDGTVQGMVGDARLLQGRVVRNRGAIGRALRLRTDWIIDARLDGPLVGAESISRERIRLPFDVRGDTLRGGFHASGGGEAISASFALRRSVGPGKC